MRTHTLTARTRGLSAHRRRRRCSCGAGLGLRTAPAQQQQPQQQTEIEVVIGGDAGAPPRFAVPDFVAADARRGRDRQDASRQVLWDDLNFEREFYLIPRDTYATVPAGALGRSDAPLRRGASWAPTA